MNQSKPFAFFSSGTAHWGEGRYHSLAHSKKTPKLVRLFALLSSEAMAFSLQAELYLPCPTSWQPSQGCARHREEPGRLGKLQQFYSGVDLIGPGKSKGRWEEAREGRVAKPDEKRNAGPRLGRPRGSGRNWITALRGRKEAEVRAVVPSKFNSGSGRS